MRSVKSVRATARPATDTRGRSPRAAISPARSIALGDPQVRAEERHQPPPRVGRGLLVVRVGAVAHEAVPDFLVHNDVAGMGLLDRSDVVTGNPLVAAADEAQE